MINFIKQLWPTFINNASLSIFCLPDSKVEHFSTLEDIPGLAEKWSQDKRDVYFGTCACRQGLDAFRRGKRQDLIGMPGLWLDIVVAHALRKREGLPPDEASAIKLIETFDLEPTLLVNSGYGFHVWWLFEQPIWFDPGDYARCQKLSNKFQDKFKHHALSQEYHVDDTADLPRILRLPGTYNYKLETPKLVELLIKDGPRYSFNDLEDLFVRNKNFSIFFNPF